MKVALENATRPQLYHFAKAMQLDVNFIGATEASLLDLIRKAIPGITEIDAADSEPGPVLSNTTDIKSTHYRNDPKVIVNIASDDANGGSQPFPICNNGDHILVKRDTDVAIPYRHYLVLLDAVETVFRQETDPATGRPRTVESQQNAVRFNAKGIPSDEEIAAFHERTKDLGRELRKAA